MDTFTALAFMLITFFAIGSTILASELTKRKHERRGLLKAKS
ncbi:MAG: hypothetical protein AB1553_16250 [Nitrospirota bacterium]